MTEHAAKFVSHLEVLALRDMGAMARLRRSLAFDPGAFPIVYPYVEPFALDVPTSLRRAMYLGAAMFAVLGGSRRGVPLAEQFGHTVRSRGSASLEARFMALLDADEEQLPHRLRQVVQLLVDSPGVDIAALIDDLRWWNSPDRTVQQRWARQFYRAMQQTQSEGES